MKHKDIDWRRVVGHAYATLGDVLAVVVSYDGRKCARQKVEAPYRDLEK